MAFKKGENAVYFDKNISIEYGLELYPNGKCYLIKSDNTLRKNIVVRELTQEEYAKLDIQKGRDF